MVKERSQHVIAAWSCSIMFLQMICDFLHVGAPRAGRSNCLPVYGHGLTSSYELIRLLCAVSSSLSSFLFSTTSRFLLLPCSGWSESCAKVLGRSQEVFLVSMSPSNSFSSCVLVFISVRNVFCIVQSWLNFLVPATLRQTAQGRWFFQICCWSSPDENNSFPFLPALLLFSSCFWGKIFSSQEIRPLLRRIWCLTTHTGIFSWTLIRVTHLHL